MHAQTLLKPCPIEVPGLCNAGLIKQIQTEYSKVLLFEATATAHATGLTPPATHLRVRGDERRLASAPERAVPSHGHIDHELNLRRSLSMSQHPVPGCSESAAAASQALGATPAP